MKRTNTPALPEGATPPEPQTPDVVEGMKPWAGGDHAPDDWPRFNRVMYRGGEMSQGATEYDWRHLGSPYDIIAYTPRPTEQPGWAAGIIHEPGTDPDEQPAIVGGADREIGWRVERGGANSHCFDDRLYVDADDTCIGFLDEDWSDRVLAALTARPSAPAEVAEPWAWGWYERGGTKRAHGYLPTVDYPRDPECDPFPLYRAPAPVEPGSERS